MARAKKETAPQPIEQVLWASADKLRKNMDAAEYKHIVLGLIFLSKHGGLIDIISTIALGDGVSRSNDVLGRVYEYFLGQFALAEGKKGGQFYTPRCVVQLLS